MEFRNLSELARSFRTDAVRVGSVNGQWREVLVTDLSPSFRQSSSGLIIPSRYSRHDPLEHVYTFLTPDEVLGLDIPLEYLVSRLESIPIGDTLFFAARIMSRLRDPGVSREEVDQSLAGEWFAEPVKTKVLSLLRGPGQRILIAPQAVFFLVKVALLTSPDKVEESLSPQLPACLLAAHGLIGSAPLDQADTVIGTSPGVLGQELMANQHFNADFDGLHLMARSFHRWMQGEDRLDKAYQSATGVPILDVMTVGMVSWARAVNGEVVTPVDEFVQAGWSIGRTEAALGLLAAPIDKMRELVKAEVEEFGIEWAVSTFERFPLVIEGGMLLCLDSAYLVRRAFGWPLYWDVMNGLAHDSKARAVFNSTIRVSSENYVLKTFEGICGDPNRVYGDDQLKSKLSMSKSKVADVAVDYGDCWVVAEVTTSVLRRESVAGAADQYVEEDLDKFVKKVAQIDSTIGQLRTKSHQLTGHARRGRDSFLPVLVLAEGFPVNPISLTVMRERVREAGLLKEADIGPLEILDTIEIEMIESIQESGGPDLRTLLERKRSADLALTSMRDYLLIESGLAPRRSRRVDEQWRQVFDLIIEPFKPAEAASQ